MEWLNDDILASILAFVQSSTDRRTCAQVNRQWLRVEGFSRLTLRVNSPEVLANVIRRFPSLTSLDAHKGLRDSDLALSAVSCRSLKLLNLSLLRPRSAADDDSYASPDAGAEYDVVTDVGLAAVASHCQLLESLKLKWRLGIGDEGVTAVVLKCPRLCHLDLSNCICVTDVSLAAISQAPCLKSLLLRGCIRITNKGLSHLGVGSSGLSLDSLDLKECHQLSDSGVGNLSNCQGLRRLNLAECGFMITDEGIRSLSAIAGLEMLDLSWVVHITDLSLIELAKNCRQLRCLALTGCEGIGDVGLVALARCHALETLKLGHCPGVTGWEIELLVRSCPLLSSISLSHHLRPWVSQDVVDYLQARDGLILWV